MVLVLKLFFLLLAANLFCQPIELSLPTAEELLRQGSESRQAENYETAIRTWQRGEELYPSDVRFPAALADLFYEKKLYNLAAQAYERARKLRPLEYEYASRLAETYGLLNQDAQAIKVLQEILPHFPDDWDLLQSLAWLLFKTESLTKGVDLLEQATQRLGTNASAEMTLGTLYASLYDYERSKAHYLRSIEIGKVSRTRIFLSIAWYNLSILENTFLQYEKALEAIQNSLEYANRASNLLALGEMYEKRGDYELARITYEEAATKDDTPLAWLNLARLYLLVGDPDTAASYLSRAEKHPDSSWIYNFGLRKEDWERDLNENWAEIFEAKVKLLHYQPRFWPWEWVSWLIQRVELSLKAWTHRERWRDLSWKSAEHSQSQGNVPSMLWKQYRTFYGYEWPSVKYLKLNRSHDEPKIPGISSFYNMRQALDLKDASGVESALKDLNLTWDAPLRHEALSFLIQSHRNEHMPDLWQKNAGMLLLNARPMGFRLVDEEGILTWFDRHHGQSIGFLDPHAETQLRVRKVTGGVIWTVQVQQKTREGFIASNLETHPSLIYELMVQTHRVLVIPSSSQ